MTLPTLTSESALDDALSRPDSADAAAAAAIEGDVAVLGCGGKMGPSLVRLLRRALDAAGRRHRVVAVSRFARPGLADALRRDGIEVIPADLLDPETLAALPDASYVILMAGHKFGSTADPPVTWATNALLPGLVAHRYEGSRLVAFSTGNVYPLVPVATGGSVETDPVGPIGEYAWSALARERVLEGCARRAGTPMALLRLNYAVELRYGVLRDVADRVLRGEPVDLTMGYVNVIWQRDANAVALRALAHCASPPLVLNVTGPEVISIRNLAQDFAERLSLTPRFRGREAETALLSNAARCHDLFGPPAMPLEQMVDLVARWAAAGGASWDLPTHFSERDGRF